MSGTIEVAVPALVDAYQQADSEGFWMALRPQGSAEGASEAVRAALAATSERHFEMLDGENGAMGGEVWVIPDGLAVQLAWAESWEAFEPFVRTLVAELEARGVTGSFGELPSARIEVEAREETSVAVAASIPVDVAALRRDIRDHPRPVGWYGDQDATAELLERTLDWCADAGDLYLGQGGMRVRVGRDQALPLLTPILQSGHSVSLTGATEGREFRRVTLNHRGQFVLVYRREGLPYSRHIAQLAPVLRQLAPSLEQAAIRRSPGVEGVWDNVMSGPNRRAPMGQRVSDQSLRHLADHRVWDAFGAQVLTDAQLAATTDLSGWRVEPLPGGRHLVTAPDLAPWFDQVPVDPVVLDRARRDFGAAIVTPDNLGEQSPRPW